ncbi:DUF2304 domain-containing protein [Thermophilibacter provencensis]|uniref:DUF2304 domain-containing protein n=1 Tax=Thermophilibacter provencensis TaxID=1852386 RepID=UPI00094AB5C5|nr:DUF2304 domain-containing protein [Thermophilibacter provencensis]
MSVTLRICIAIFCILLAFYVIRLVSRRRLLLKYSLLWLTLVVGLLLSALFPDCVILLSGLLGFEMAANFIFFIGLFCLMAIALSLTVIVSRQSQKISVLTQRLAIVEYCQDKRQDTRGDA